MDKLTKAFVTLIYVVAMVCSTSSKPQRKPKSRNKFKMVVWGVIIASVAITTISYFTPAKQTVTEYSCVMPDSPDTMTCEKVLK